MVSTYVLPGIKGVVSDLKDCNFLKDKETEITN